MLTPWKESCNQPRQHIIKQKHHFADKGLYSQSYDFSSTHVQMWDLDHKEGWVPKNWCFWIVVLEKTLKSPLDFKESKSVHPKGNQSWIFIGRTDAEAENFGHLMWGVDSLEKTLMLGKTEGKKKGEAEDKMVGWYHRFNGHESEQIPGDSGGQQRSHTTTKQKSQEASPFYPRARVMTSHRGPSQILMTLWLEEPKLKPSTGRQSDFCFHAWI